MESEFFLNNGIPPQPSSLLFESTSPLSATIPIHFESAMSSMVSSPDVSNYTMSNESFMIRELIGKLGNINNSSSLETAEISPNSKQIVAASFMNIVDSTTTNTSCYSTPLNSPPQMSLHVMDRVQSEQMGFPRLGNHHPVGLNPNPNVQVQHPIAEFTADPGFAERAARFSCFGRRSFNGRTGINNGELPYRGNALNGKMVRVSSSPSLKVMVQQGNTSSSPLQDRSELGNSNQDESMVCERFTNGDIKGSSELNSRKRKASKDKAKEPTPIPQTKDADSNGTSNSKRSKPNKVAGNEIEPVKAEDEAKARENEKQSDNLKPIEPPKDYIHVRARRGQATDSHSLAERVRREKISERMKLLQDLVPGCNKVTGKALMLDEIINYVQSLQRQVEFLSMKLASVNTRMDFNMDTPITKDIFQSNNSQQQPIFALDSSASAIFGHQSQQNPALNSIISNGLVTKCSVDSLAVQQLPPLCGNNPTIPPYPTFCEDDLQTIVQMGFGQNLNLETALQTQNFHGTNQVSQMKTEP